MSGRLGNENITNCETCTAGLFCRDYGMSAPSGPCYEGYFCPGGQDSPMPVDLACSPGHFCVNGSHNQTGCASGWFQPHWRQSTCDICPAGSYCKAFGKSLASKKETQSLTHWHSVLPVVKAEETFRFTLCCRRVRGPGCGEHDTRRQLLRALPQLQRRLRAHTLSTGILLSNRN